MKANAIILWLVLACSLYPKVPLSKVFHDAIRNQASVKNQKLEEATMQIQTLNARLRRWFSIDFTGSYRYTSDTMQITSETFPFPQTNAMPSGTVLAAAPNHTIDLKLSLIQPLYTGGIIKNTILAEEIREASETHITRLRAGEVVIKVKISFFTCQLLQKKIDSLQLLSENLMLHLARLDYLFKEELVRKSDLLETRSRLAEIGVNLQELRQLLEMEKIQFQRLTGFSFDEIESDYREEDTTPEEALHLLRTIHPMVLALDERMRQNTVQKRIVAGSALPQVVGFAEFHYSRPGMNFFKDAWIPYFLGGVNISLSVFNWKKPQRDSILVEISRKKIENYREDFLIESEKNLRQLYVQQASQMEKLKLLEQQVAIAREEMVIKEKMYEENQIDHISYLMAITQLERVQSQMEELKTQQELIKVNLWAVIGKIPEEK